MDMWQSWSWLTLPQVQSECFGIEKVRVTCPEYRRKGAVCCGDRGSRPGQHTCSSPALAPPCSDPIHCSAKEADPQELQGGFL